MLFFVPKKFRGTLNKRLLIIVPLFNESKRGASYIQELSENISRVETDIDFLIIDDASTDDTYTLLNELKEVSTNNLKVIKNKTNMGHGNTVVNGYKYSIEQGYDFIAQVDGDNNVEPESVNRLINYSINENLEFVLGKRIVRPDPIIRRVITFILDLNLRLRFNVKFKDTNAGIRIHSNSFLKSINLNNLNNLKIPNALITTFAFYLNARTSSYPVIMRNNIKEQRKGEQWGSGVGLKSKIKLLRGGIICFYEVNTKFSNILIKNKGYC